MKPVSKSYILIIFLLIIMFWVMSFLFFIINYKTVRDKAVRDLPEIMKVSALNIVTKYNPTDYYISGDSIAGLQYELYKYIGKRSGLIVNVYLENNLEVSIRSLQNKTYDVIARNIPITSANKQFLSFTIPIDRSNQVLVQRIKSENDSVLFIDNQTKLAHKTVYIPQGSSVILRLKHLSEEIAEPIYIQEIADYTSEHLIYMVAHKNIDYTVVDKKTAIKSTTMFPELDFGTDISFTQLQAWAVRQTSPVLLDSLNVWLSEFMLMKGINRFLQD